MSGRLLPGTHLPVAALAQELGTSATPVREGLLSLVQDGWLVQELNRGFRVAAIDRETVVDAYVVYAFVAGELAARGAERATPADIQQLRALEHSIQKAPDSSHAHVESINYDLHRMIYDIARSPRLVWFIEAASRFVPRRFWPTIPGWSEFNASGHAPIIAALEDGDPGRAREAMSGHIRAAGDLLVGHLDRVAFWPGSTS